MDYFDWGFLTPMQQINILCLVVIVKAKEIHSR